MSLHFFQINIVLSKMSSAIVATLGICHVSWTPLNIQQILENEIYEANLNTTPHLCRKGHSGRSFGNKLQISNKHRWTSDRSLFRGGIDTRNHGIGSALVIKMNLGWPIRSGDRGERPAPGLRPPPPHTLSTYANTKKYHAREVWKH